MFILESLILNTMDRLPIFDKLPSNGRCSMCGRFIKRGLYNYILHSNVCPERQILVLFGLNKGRIIKLKNMKEKY